MNVYDSVQQIQNECVSLIEIADSYPEYYDVKMHSIKLRNNLDELVKAFDENPGDTTSLNTLKFNTERAGLELEYYLVVRCHRYVERYDRRLEANRLYTELKAYVFDNIKDKDLIVKYYDYLEWALNYWSRSKHLLFEITESDRVKLDEILEIIRGK